MARALIVSLAILTASAPAAIAGDVRGEWARDDGKTKVRFAADTHAGGLHTSIKPGSGKQAARTPAFKWVNTALSNIKAALVGTYRAVREKHVPRYLAEFEYRFNRRYDLKTMIPRLAFVALRTAPMPYRLLKLADVAAR